MRWTQADVEEQYFICDSFCKPTRVGGGGHCCVLTAFYRLDGACEPNHKKDLSKICTQYPRRQAPRLRHVLLVPDTLRLPIASQRLSPTTGLWQRQSQHHYFGHSSLQSRGRRRSCQGAPHPPAQGHRKGQ